MDFFLDLSYFYFSNPNTNPNLTHSPKHWTLSPNHQFFQRIWYGEHHSVHTHMAWSQKFRLTPGAISPRYARVQGPSLRGDMSPPTFGPGGHYIFCPPQYFVIKNNVVEQICNCRNWIVIPVSSEISDFTPCMYAQSNILHAKCVDKTDYWGLGIRVLVSVSG